MIERWPLWAKGLVMLALCVGFLAAIILAGALTGWSPQDVGSPR